MKTFTVLYVTLPEHAELKGWEAPDMKAYADLSIFPKEENVPALIKGAIEHGLLKPAAKLAARDAEVAFVMLQSHERPWRENVAIECLTQRPRSMSVGDIIYEEDTDTWMLCMSMGFHEITDFDTRRMLRNIRASARLGSATRVREGA